MISGISGYNIGYADYLNEIRQKMVQNVDSALSIDASEMSALIQQSTAGLIDLYSASKDLAASQIELISMIASESVLLNLVQQIKSEETAIDWMFGTQFPPPPDKVFDIADTNSDDYISKEELGAVIGEGSAEKLFGAIDTDGDNLISRSEDADFLSSIKEDTGKNASVTSLLNGMGGLVQEWQIKAFMEIISNLNATSILSSDNSTSFFA